MLPQSAARQRSSAGSGAAMGNVRAEMLCCVGYPLALIWLCAPAEGRWVSVFGFFVRLFFQNHII